MTEKIKYYGRGGGRQLKDCVAIVFVNEVERPIENGDILGDFAWRRNHRPPHHLKPQVLELVSEALDIPIDELRVEYNRKAGCSMCPCSPGFIVRGAGPNAWMHDQARSRWIPPYNQYDRGRVEIQYPQFSIDIVVPAEA